MFIADDHDLLRAGTGAILAFGPDLEVVGEAHDGGETVELCKRPRPDLVLMDPPMPRMDGMASTAR